jgi:hypothetical protein
MLMQHYQYGIKDVPKEYYSKFVENGWKELANNDIEVLDKAEESIELAQKKRGRPFKVKA